MNIEREITIKYQWWNNKLQEINPMALEVLDKSAKERITYMMGEDFTSGELNEDIEDINYQGWWEMTTRTTHCSQPPNK